MSAEDNVPYIDADEEEEFIRHQTGLASALIWNVLNVYYPLAAKEGNPEAHYSVIMRQVDISQEQLQCIFDAQFDFLCKKGIAEIIEV